MHGAILSYGLLGLLAIALLFAAFTDLKRRQIDNWLNAGIALAAPLFWWSCHLPLVAIGWQVAVAVATLMVLAILFALRAMGGGDVKLLAALALWLPIGPFLHLLTVMAISGGVLTLVIGAWHITRKQRDRVAIPYGVAIALGAFWVLGFEYLPLVRAGAAIG